MSLSLCDELRACNRLRVNVQAAELLLARVGFHRENKHALAPQGMRQGEAGEGCNCTGRSTPPRHGWRAT